MNDNTISLKIGPLTFGIKKMNWLFSHFILVTFEKVKLRSSKRFVTVKRNLKIKIPLVYNLYEKTGQFLLFIYSDSMPLHYNL